MRNFLLPHRDLPSPRHARSANDGRLCDRPYGDHSAKAAGSGRKTVSGMILGFVITHDLK